MKNVIILLSIFLFFIVVGVGHAGDTNKPKANMGFIFYYDDNGKLVNVELGPGSKENCEEKARGDDVHAYLKKLIKEGYTIESAQDDFIKMSKNPDCWIYIGNIPICWCCK